MNAWNDDGAQKTNIVIHGAFFTPKWMGEVLINCLNSGCVATVMKTFKADQIDVAHNR